MIRPRKALVALAATALAAASLVTLGVSAWGLVPPDPNQVIQKVSICHRTNANTNP